MSWLGRFLKPMERTCRCVLMRQVAVDARDKNNRAEQFYVITTILDAAIDGAQIGVLYERRWQGEVDIRSIKSTIEDGHPTL